MMLQIKNELEELKNKTDEKNKLNQILLEIPNLVDEKFQLVNQRLIRS